MPNGTKLPLDFVIRNAHVRSRHADLSLSSTVLQDIRYATRKLARTPSFTLVASITLALAVGAIPLLAMRE